MASTLKSLIKDTAIYGLSSMVGRFLNWLMTIVYVRVLVESEFGVMTNLYAWTALLLIILTYGMETAFFRFASKHERPRLVYGTTLTALGTTSTLFALLGLYFVSDITATLSLSGSEDLVGMLIVIVALDAFCAIPLGYLRYEQRPWRFMAVRMGFVLLTIALTLITFYILPLLASDWINPQHSLRYIFGINLVGCIVQLVMLLPTIRMAERACSWAILRQMLAYAWPVLLLGLVGSFSNQADKILLPLMYDDPATGQAQLGIYGACYKLAVIMVLFTQAFRYAYDPFVFARSRDGGEAAKAAYADAMKYYILFTLVIFVGVMSTLDVLKLFIVPTYYAGLPIVPLVMAGQLMFGIYFNLSLWFKLTDRTWWGAILSILGCVVTVLIIVLGTRPLGFMAAAWASVVANALMMTVSYFLGQRYYPIKYPLKAIASYTLLASGILALQYLWTSITPSTPLRLALNLLLLLLFVAFILWREVPRSTLAALRRRLPI